MSSQPEITQLLVEWSNGDRNAFDQLLPLVDAELHRMAKHQMAAQSREHTLQATALIHEAYVRLTRNDQCQWEGRAHFFRVAAMVMRNILVDHARSKLTRKRGPDSRTRVLNEAILVCDERMKSLVALNDALEDLAKLHRRQSDVVEMRYFGGFSVAETAQILNVSADTVMRD